MSYTPETTHGKEFYRLINESYQMAMGLLYTYEGADSLHSEAIKERYAELRTASVKMLGKANQISAFMMDEQIRRKQQSKYKRLSQ